MSLKLSYVAVLLVIGGSAVSIAAAPVAAASGADSVIAGLQADGYDVQINWVNGFDTEPLAVCTVTDVNNPDHSGGPRQAGETVYVDVSCPNHDYD